LGVTSPRDPQDPALPIRLPIANRDGHPHNSGDLDGLERSDFVLMALFDIEHRSADRPHLKVSRRGSRFAPRTVGIW
jgi:hypothetical protein